MEERVEAVEASGWWQRPCGGRDVVKLAVPLILSTGSWTLMHFFDRVLLTWYSNDAIAAATPAGMLNFSLMCLPLGIAGYVNTFVAQYFGAGRSERVGRVVWQGIWLGLIALPFMLMLIPLAPTIFEWGNHEPNVVREEIRYFQTLALGGGAAVIAAAQSSFFTGLGFTRIVMVVDMIVAVLNLALDYILIWGRLDLPALGVAGAGLATSLAQWTKVAILAWMMSRGEFRHKYGLVEGFGWDGQLFGRLLRFGAPSGLQMAIEVCAFTVFMFLMGQLGRHELAATNIAFSVNSLTFIPMMGLGIAVATLVGQQIGGERPDLAARATWTSAAIGGIYTLAMCFLFVAAPDLFMAPYAAGAGSEFQAIRSTCYVLLRFVAAYCFVDTMQIVFSSAIKGAGDTRFVLLVTSVVSPIPVLLAWGGIRYWNWGLWAFWLVVTCWILLLGAIFLARFLGGKWRSMRVIEPDVVAVEDEMASA